VKRALVVAWRLFGFLGILVAVAYFGPADDPEAIALQAQTFASLPWLVQELFGMAMSAAIVQSVYALLTELYRGRT
jgi:hypothetical protein